MPDRLDDDALADATEQEHVDAGLEDYHPIAFPPATDPLSPEASGEADPAQRVLTGDQPEE